MTLRIGFFPVPDYLAYFVMQEQGLAQKESLRFEEVAYPSGGAALVEGMATGSADVGWVGTVPVLGAASRGLVPGTIVPAAAGPLADPDHPVVGVLAGFNVGSWRDLEGQPVAVNAVSSINTAAVKGRLVLEGVRNQSLLEIPLPNMGLAVAGGNVAAAAMAEPWLTQSLLRRDGKLLGWVVGGPPFERFQTSFTVFAADLYRTNPTAVKAFLRAYVQSSRWISQNPEGARSILVRRLGLSEEVGRKMGMPRWSLDARNDPAMLGSMQPLLVDVGLLKEAIPARRLYDETVLEEILAEKL